MSKSNSNSASASVDDATAGDLDSILGTVDDAVEEQLGDDDIAHAEQLAEDQFMAAREQLQDSWKQLDLQGAKDALADAYGWRAALKRIRDPKPEKPTVHIDSLVLADCYQSLFDNPDIESIVYLTGMELDSHHSTVNRHIEMDHAVQKAVKAAGSPDSSFETLLELENSGHQLLAHCHNHPGKHNAAPKPSEVDRTYQDQLEGGGYEAVGLIMSVDGYVRIYTNDFDVNVKIHGNHVQRLDEKRLYLEEPARNASARLQDT